MFIIMQAAKNIIKIQLSHFNHILPVTPISNHHHAAISIPEATIKAEPNKEKEEKADSKASKPIQYVPADQQQLHQINDETKNEEGIEDNESTYKQILSCVAWHCPCGKKVYGPIQYFQHIKQKHQFDTLQKIIQEKTLKKMFQFYPNVHKNQIQIIQELDKVPFEQIWAELASKYANYLKCKQIEWQQAKQRGSFSDMATKFVQSIEDSNAKIVMRFFFSFLHEFVNVHFGKHAWSQQSPKDLLKYSNQIFNYFAEKQVKAKYRPFDEQDIKRVIYLVSKWMFINRWTNDRIFNALPPQNDSSQCDEISPETIQQKKQTEEQHH